MIEYPITQGAFRTPGGHSCMFAYREGTNDWNTLSASLDNDEYGLPRGQIGTALDVGGYLGSVGIALALDNPQMRVLIIEPVPDNILLIRRNIELNGVGDRVELIEGAVGKGGEEVKVWYRYRGSVSLEHHAFVGNSSIAYDHGGEAEHDEIVYKALGLTKLLGEDYRGVRLDFVKIDCEGGEWAFLDSDAVRFLPHIVGEAHAVRGHKGKDIRSLLEPTHDVYLLGDEEGTCGFRAVLR